jgi:hypothetical protein
MSFSLLNSPGDTWPSSISSAISAEWELGLSFDFGCVGGNNDVSSYTGVAGGFCLLFDTSDMLISMNIETVGLLISQTKYQRMCFNEIAFY